MRAWDSRSCASLRSRERVHKSVQLSSQMKIQERITCLGPCEHTWTNTKTRVCSFSKPVGAVFYGELSKTLKLPKTSPGLDWYAALSPESPKPGP